METLFENYELFIREHQDEFSTPNSAIRMLNDEAMFRAYVDSITEGLVPSTRSSVIGVLNRQRNMLLTESANVGASAFASGWTVNL